MNAALAIATARRRAGLSKRELARRSSTSPAAIVEYESGRRDPTVGTLDRILRAAGSSAVITIEPQSPVDRDRAARVLADVLSLVDAIPMRAAARSLPYPPFGR